nr:cysteine desulfurase family protein [Metabacillus lacus]
MDHAATSPVHPDVISKMSSYMAETFGNPSSIHSFGRQSRKFLDDARYAAARSISCKPSEIIFTSGGTEADNMAIIGAAMANRHRGRHIITTAIEHHAVLHSCQYLEKNGFEVTYLPVNEEGSISLEDLQNSLTDSTILVSIMYANNEVGTIQPIKEVGALLQEHEALFHTDAVQAYGVEDIKVKEIGADLLSVSAHKINGPKGVGFLYAKEGIKLQPSQYGGEQELKRRAGTENAAGIAGFHEAISIVERERGEKRESLKALKEEMISVFNSEEVRYEINGHEERSLPHILNVYFPGTHIESLLVNLDLSGIAASSGSACTAGSVDPSHVLVSMFGKESERSASSVRFSFGLGNTKNSVSEAALKVCGIVKRLTAAK